MARKPSDANSFIEVDPFDVFRVEGDVDRLNGQRFDKDKIRQSTVHQGIRSTRLMDDQKIDTDAQRLIRDARYAQQQALKDLNAIDRESGLASQRKIIASHGPEQQRMLVDGAGPEQQRIISDAGGPILPHHVRRAALHEPITKARIAQQKALKEIHAIKDMIFSSSANQRDRLDGPIKARTLSDASGPVLSPVSSTTDTPGDRKNLSTQKLLERIKKTRAEQQEALKHLHAMQDAEGPQNDRAMSDLDLTIEKASNTQLAALGYMKKLEDTVGPLIKTHWSDAEAETGSKAWVDAAGPVTLRNADDATGMTIPISRDDTSGPASFRGAEDASGPETPRHADDVVGPLTPREATDAVGPLVSREWVDSAGPRAPNTIDDAVGPTDRRLITDAKGPTLFHRIVEAVLPKKIVRSTTQLPADDSPHQSSIAERIAKVKADQRDAMQQLGELEKDNDKPLL